MRRSLCNARACSDSRQRGLVDSVRHSPPDTVIVGRGFQAPPTRGLTTSAKATVVRRSFSEGGNRYDLRRE